MLEKYCVILCKNLFLLGMWEAVSMLQYVFYIPAHSRWGPAVLFLPLSRNMFSYTLYCINNTKTNSRALVFLGNQSVFAPLCTKWMSFAM